MALTPNPDLYGDCCDVCPVFKTCLSLKKSDSVIIFMELIVLVVFNALIKQPNERLQKMFRYFFNPHRRQNTKKDEVVASSFFTISSSQVF